MPTPKSNLIIVFFPYLFSNEIIELNKITLYPSYKSFFEKQTRSAQAHLKRLANSFSYGKHTNINQYMFGTIRISDKSQWDELVSDLNTFSKTLAYSELSDERNGAQYSNFSYVAFEIIRPINHDKFYFYNGWLNGVSEIRLSYPDTRYRPNIELRPYIVRENEKLKKLLSHLYWGATFISADERKRMLRALSWFNKSCKNDSEIEDADRFMFLSAAFESLFNNSNEGVQSQISTGVMALLGESEEMKKWIRSFYDKRSKIMHGQEYKDTYYQAQHTSTAHIEHIVYAQKVFARCVKLIVDIREEHYVRDLHEELISNEKRLSEIKNTLKETKRLRDLKKSKIFSTITSLSNKDATGSVTSVVTVGKQLLDLLTPTRIKNNRVEIIKAARAIHKFKGTQYGDLAVLYSNFGEKFRDVYFNDEKSTLPLGYRAALYTFSSYASWRLFYEAFIHRTILKS